MLPRIVGLGRANDLLLTSRVFWSDEAERIGFVNQLHDAEVLVSAAQAYATDLIESVSPESLRQTRWQVYQDLHGSVAESVNHSEKLLEAMMRDDDYREGVKAFLEKRKPKWPSLKHRDLLSHKEH